MLGILVKLVVVAALNAGVAALQARSLIAALRVATQRFVGVFYRDFVKIFGEGIIRAVGHALSRLLGARSAERAAARVYTNAGHVSRSERAVLTRPGSARGAPFPAERRALRGLPDQIVRWRGLGLQAAPEIQSSGQRPRVGDAVQRT